MAELSVIIPIYNVEKYLRQCLDSVVNQTFRDLEIILVDDGSPDHCGEICDEYAKKDSRISVLHKKNEGLPSARNDALDMVTGKWVAFVDSDDWLETDIYEKAIAAGNKYDVDILFFNSFQNTNEKETAISLFPNEFFTDDNKFIKNLQAGTMCKYLTQTKELGYGYPWDRIIKREFILQNKLYFTKVKAYEDILYAINCLQYANKIVFIEDRGYHYRFNETSIGNKYTPDRIDIDKVIFREMFRLGDLYRVNDNYYQALYALIVQSVVAGTKRCFFNKNNKKSFWAKMQYVRNVLQEEPYYKAFSEVNRKLLTRSGKFITLVRHHNSVLLYVYYLCTSIKKCSSRNEI